ncbi:LCP family protein [Clostridium sp.]|uniref:LCP family protein n=1 Tax=Clostridium sp. TaxID=1506 RepID=UPI00260536B6|nr:LCP family protein [Clostridium sp.]
MDIKDLEDKEDNGVKKRRVKGKKNKKKKIAIISIISLILALLIAGISIYFKIRSNVYTEYVPEKVKELSYSEVEGITNVLLIGTDGRTLDEPSRSDSIIIATLDNNNKKVKLTTIMRDTLVEIPEYGEDKINAAFALGALEEDKKGNLKGAEGGAALLMKTIEDNFNLHLDKYVVVNFWGFEAIIDEINGIEIDVKDYEIDEVNKYIGESTGVNSPMLEEPGLQHLNGQQALSYARIRYVGNGNFERGERQTRVLKEVAESLKSINPIKYVNVANTMSKHVKTNIDIPQALNLAYTIYKFPTLNINQLQIPQAELIARDNLYKDKGWCLLIDLKQSSKVLYDFIFNDKEPNTEEFDIQSVLNVLVYYNDKEARYNSIYNIKPEDYNDKEEKEEITPTVPVEKPKPDPKPDPNPTPGQTPNPTPGQIPNPTPDPTPGQTPDPTPGQTPNPTPDPMPNPTPDNTR